MRSFFRSLLVLLPLPALIMAVGGCSSSPAGRLVESPSCVPTATPYSRVAPRMKTLPLDAPQPSVSASAYYDGQFVILVFCTASQDFGFSVPNVRLISNGRDHPPVAGWMEQSGATLLNGLLFAGVDPAQASTSEVWVSRLTGGANDVRRKLATLPVALGSDRATPCLARSTAGSAQVVCTELGLGVLAATKASQGLTPIGCASSSGDCYVLFLGGHVRVYLVGPDSKLVRVSAIEGELKNGRKRLLDPAFEVVIS